VTKSCAGSRNVLSSPDALGLLADLHSAGCALAPTWALAPAETVGTSSDWPARASLPLRIDNRVPVAGRRCGRVARLGSGTHPRPTGSGCSWTLAHPDCGNCRRRDFGRFAVAQFAADGPIIRQGPGIHAAARRTNFAEVGGGTDSLLRVGSDGGIMRRVSVPGIRHGGSGSGGPATLGRCAIVLCSFRSRASISRTRWAVEHTGRRSSFRNGANRVRWHDSGNGLALRDRRRSRSGWPEVPIETGTSNQTRDFHRLVIL
jgi:hypothetical protein